MPGAKAAGGSLREIVRPFYLRRIYFPLFPKRKPPEFDAAWRYPDARPPDAAQNPLQRPAILFLPMNDWHARAQRTAHLALALSRMGYPCVYLNPHLGREFAQRPARSHPDRLTELAPGLYELHVHLPREPVFHHRPLKQAESSAIAQAMTRAVSFIGARAAIQIAAFPVWIGAMTEFRRLNGTPIIYDCHDYLPGFPAVAPSILDLESELFRVSDRIVVSSASLAHRAASYRPPGAIAPALIRNAATPGLLDPPLSPAPATAPITVGYVGALESWFDCAAVRAAAQARPQWRFQLVGRVENAAVERLAELPNVTLAGEIPHGRLGESLARFHVAVIPFLLSPLIEATDPIKVYEYFAAGLPVVASNLPELDRFAPLLGRYRTPGEFIAQLDAAVAESSSDSARDRQTERRAVAAAETWAARAATLSELIESLAPAQS